MSGLQKSKDTTIDLTKHHEALLKYVRTFGFYPCPADGRLTNTDANFGIGQGTGTGTCTGMEFSYNEGAADAVYMGVLPVKTLGMKTGDMLDSWGNRIMYTVAQNVTSAATYSQTPRIIILNNYDENEDMPTNISNYATSITEAYVLSSFGANGVGAYPYHGGTARVQPASAEDDSPLQHQNHGLDYASTPGIDESEFDNVFVQPATPNTAYDDVVAHSKKYVFNTIDINDNPGDPIPSPDGTHKIAPPGTIHENDVKLLLWLDASDTSTLHTFQELYGYNPTTPYEMCKDGETITVEAQEVVTYFDQGWLLGSCALHAEPGQPKFDVCHNGHTINIAEPAVHTHLTNHAHNDYLGPCAAQGENDRLLRWDDKSGNDHHAIYEDWGDGSAPPTYSGSVTLTGTSNSIPVVDFDGDEKMKSYFCFPAPAYGGPCTNSTDEVHYYQATTIFMVGQRRTLFQYAGYNQKYQRFFYDGLDHPFRHGNFVTNYNKYALTAHVDYHDYIKGGTATTDAEIHSALFNYEESALFVNGALQIYGDVGTEDIKGLTIGASKWPAWSHNYLDGKIAEIIVYAGHVDAERRHRIEAYLAEKWGISNISKEVVPAN
ncbi:MAG: hypothetical protein OXT08_07420 [Candidatus Marinimicrobia bacterium]|nr:hypothetical protein [Candidatus Neomarinimicrobiota bacterium]